MRINTVKSLPVKPSLDCFYFLLKEGSKTEGELKVYSAGKWKGSGRGKVQWVRHYKRNRLYRMVPYSSV